MKYYYSFAATEYNSDAYGAGTYNGQATEQTTPPPATPADSGPLANTGYDIIIPVALGIAIVGASALLMVKKLRNKKA